MILNSHKGRYTSNTIRKQNTDYDDLKRFQKERKKVKKTKLEMLHTHIKTSTYQLRILWV